MNQTETPSNSSFIDAEWIENVNNLWLNCETSKYFTKYNIKDLDIGYSLSFRTFTALIWNLKQDVNENFQIKFNFDKNVSFGRQYLRYSLNLMGTFSREVFIQIPYHISNYKDGSLFTLLNIYEQVNGLDSELSLKQMNFIQECFSDFVTNCK